MEKPHNAPPIDRMVLRLYFTGQSPKSVLAIENLKMICDKHILSRPTVELIDVLVEPLRLIRDSIPTTPLLIRMKPLPERRILGDLSNWKQVLGSLEIAVPA